MVKKYRKHPRRKVHRRKRVGNDNQLIHKFVQTVPGVLCYNDPVTANGFGFKFTLADLSQQSTFTDLFDQYRITKIECSLMPRAVTTHLSGTAIGTTPTYMYYAVDYDDGNAPTTVGELQQYGNCRTICMTPGTVKHISFKPHVAMAAFSGAFTSYANMTNQWLDCASPSVQHYGLKVIFPPGGAGVGVGSVAFDMVFKYYLSFRNVR